jgi:hypothetical protein
MADTDATETTPTRSTEDDAILKDARDFWKKVSAAEDAQRKRILKAKQFRAGDQWPAAIKLAREGAGSITGQGPAPARPCLVVDRLSQPVRQVSNTIKNADFGFDVLPNGQGADTETADIFKGYLRRVQNQARGESPIEWAADGAIEGGIGWFRLRTDYVHESWDGDPTDPEAYDQELRMERITNNLTVYCDPSANRPTRSDARRMLITEDLDRDDFKAKYKHAKCDMRSLTEFTTTGDMEGWVSDDIIRIAEFWCITYEDRPIYLLEDGTAGEGVPPKGAKVAQQRVVRKPVVKGYKINACEVLERWDWAGSRIPIIPVIGEELNVDGKPWLRGVIEMGMGPQTMVNYTYSAGVEIFALSSRKAPIVPMGAIARYKNIWDSRTTTSWSYWPYDAWDDQGRQQPPPMFDPTEPPIQAAVELMRTSEEAIKATTSAGDASLGNSNPNERSGKALNALQAQSDLANSNYPDNVRRALIYAAELMVEIIPKITRPGQILHIMGLDDEPQQVMAGKPFKPGANGVPEAAPEDITPDIAKDPQSLYKFYDLDAGRYAVTVTVGKATATRREEGAHALGELIPHLPPEMQIKVLPDYIKQLSFPGAQGIAEKLEPPSADQSLPPQVQQQMQQMQQALQQAQQQIQNDTAKYQAQGQIEQMKQQNEMQREQMRIQADLQKAHMDNAARIEVARIGAAKETLNQQAAAAEERLSTGLTIQHEAQQAALDRAHDAGMSAMSGVQGQQGAEADRAHQAEMAAQGQSAQSEQAEAGRQHEVMMAEQQAQQAAEEPTA